MHIPVHSSSNASNPSATSSGAIQQSSKGSVGPIAGGVVAGVVALVLVSLALFVFLRRRRRQISDMSGTSVEGTSRTDNLSAMKGPFQSAPTAETSTLVSTLGI